MRRNEVLAFIAAGPHDFSVSRSTTARLVERANEDLANGLGNLVNRVVVMVHRYRDGRPPAVPPEGAGELPAVQLTPFLPVLAARIAEQCIALSDSLARPLVLVPRL